MSAACSPGAASTPAPTPFIERERFVASRQFVDSQNQALALPEGFGGFFRMFLRSMQFELEDGSWLNTKEQHVRAIYDSGTWITILSASVVKAFSIRTWPVRQGGLKVALHGAFETDTSETCPVCYIQFGFEELPSLRFRGLCAISEKRRVSLIGDEIFSGLTFPIILRRASSRMATSKCPLPGCAWS
jgi:hypothetical protein